MFAILLLLLDILLLFVSFSSFSDKKKIIVTLAETISVFLCLYIVTSALMWALDCFSVEFCLLAVTFFALLIFVFSYYKSDTKGLDFFKIGIIRIDYRVFLSRLAIFVAVFLSLGAYSTIGIGYNDGNAQIQAVSILNGNKYATFEVSEYENIKTGSQYEQYFIDSVSNIDKQNFTADYEIYEVNS